MSESTATAPVLVCTDGSDLSLAAISAGLGLIGDDAPIVVAMVLDGPHAFAMTGSGHAGPTMDEDEFNRQTADAVAYTESAMAQTAEAVGRPDAECRTLDGEPGQAICNLAGEISARAIVMGTRGRSGLKRAVLGSVSDYVVRNAPCTVVVTPPVDDA